MTLIKAQWANSCEVQFASLGIHLKDIWGTWLDKPATSNMTCSSLRGMAALGELIPRTQIEESLSLITLFKLCFINGLKTTLDQLVWPDEPRISHRIDRSGLNGSYGLNGLNRIELTKVDQMNWIGLNGPIWIK